MNTQWLPMGTAPTDGRLVWLKIRNIIYLGHYYRCLWLDGPSGWLLKAELTRNNGVASICHACTESEVPDGWQAVPEEQP